MLLLLDIDGVMVPANSWKKPEFLADGFPAFSNNATDALQKIIIETNASIVLTTSHKFNYTLEQWNDIFKTRGIKVDNISRLPENKDYLSRKNEILNWLHLTKNSVENFIIIDDDKSLNGLPKNIKDRLIQTNAMIGLTNELAEESLKLPNSLELV